jgi:DNA-binding winged helix-turn-helix (wHTH) protein
MKTGRSLISFQPDYCSSFFHVDQEHNRLFQDEDQEPIELGELRLICTEILVYLIKNNERVVSVDELIGAVLAGEGNARLVREAVKAIRTAVGESCREQLTIRTHRGGYQFIAELVTTDFLPPDLPDRNQKRGDR